MSRLSCRGGLCALFRPLFVGIQLVAFCAAVPRGIVGQTALVNGSNHPGTISANGSASYTFTGNAGENVVLRVGAQSFVPKIELSGPNGSVVATAPTVAPGSGNRDAVLASKLASAGAYTVKVSSYYAGGAGTFTLRFAQIPGTFTVSVDDEGGSLVSGGRSNGTIDLGDLDVWTFSGNSGDSIQVRIGTTGSLVPQITLYGPDGTQVGTAPAVAPGSGGRDAVISTRLTQNGNYTVIANSYYVGGVGSYILSLAQAPGTITVATNDEGGDLPNGAHTGGIIDTGDLDVWSFTATAGDSVQIRMGAAFPPKLDLYGPDGTLVETAPAVAQGSGGRDVVIETRLAASGKYTLVSSAYYSGSSGSYTVNLIRAPGEFVVPVNDQGGALTNGWQHTGTLDVGDLDAWSFQANAGDSIELRMGTGAYPPRLDLYAPSGALVDSAPKVAQGSGGRDVLLTARVAESGTFTVVASAYYAGSSGNYILSLAQAPGAVTIAPNDEGGELVNGARHSARLEIGDLDVWTFSGNAGDNVQLRIGGEFPPRVALYGPNGALVESAPAVAQGSGGRDALLEVQLPSSGNYTVVSGAYYAGSSGQYALNFVRVPGEVTVSPGDQGGSLTNGWLHAGTIDFGDVDAYTFEGTAGEDIYLRLGSTDLVPRLDLYGPNGAVVASVPVVAPGSNGRDVLITNRLTSTGTYTAVASAYYSGDTGSYTLTLARSGEESPNAPGDEGGSMTNGYTYLGSNAMGDLDVWTFYGTVGDSNVFRIGTTNYVPWLRLYGPGGTLVKEAFTASIQNRTNQLSYVVTTNGTYTLVSSSYYLNQSGTYNLKQSRVPPDISNLPDSTAIDEGTTLNLTISAQDPDVPDKVLTFSLENAPPGVTLTAQGPTNAVLSWVTTEADGPSTNDFLVKVTDVANNVSFTRTNTFRVVINEVNIAPSLTVPADLTLNEMTPLPSSASASASDPDLPKNVLKYALLDAPTGMQIDESTGALSWVPEEGQGPGTYPIKIVVTDESPSAVNAQHLSTTNTFQIVVAEVNTPPAFVIQDQVVNEGVTLRVPVTVTDADLPVNGLSFALIGAPQGMSFDSQTREISWTPTEEQGPSTNRVSLVVTDDSPGAINAQHFSVTNTFTVVVREVDSSPSLSQITQKQIDELATLTVTNSATDVDLPTQVLTYRLVSPPEGATISPTGVITWTPTEAQGPTNATIVTIVTDGSTPPLSATNTFAVVVNEVNSAPVMAEIAAQSVHFGTLLSVQPSVTDADEPKNAFTFTLEGAPTGMSVDSASGATSWTPLESQVGVYTVTLRVSDGGTPAKSDTKTFQITVSGAGSRIGIERFSPSSIKLILTGDAGNQYQLQKSVDLKLWDTVVQLPLKETPTQQIEEFSGANTFYRLKLVQ